MYCLSPKSPIEKARLTLKQKPLDIHDPTIVDASKFKHELAFFLLGNTKYADKLMLYDSYLGTSRDVHGTTHDSETVGPEQTSSTDQNSPAAVEIVTHSPQGADINSRDQLPHSYKSHATNNEKHCILRSGQSLSCGLGVSYDFRSSMTLSEKAIKLWTLATVELRQEPEVYRIGHSPNLPKGGLEKRSRNFQNLPFSSGEFDEMFKQSAEFDSVILIIILSTVYGSIHLTAWNFTFPSLLERIIWRISCIIIASSAPGVFLTAIAVDRMDGRYIIKIFIALTLWLIAGLYSGARVFIIIESFISIRKLPLGVYVTVDWSKYIPHL
jgi:hypothetical protein